MPGKCSGITFRFSPGIVSHAVNEAIIKDNVQSIQCANQFFYLNYMYYLCTNMQRLKWMLWDKHVINKVFISEPPFAAAATKSPEPGTSGTESLMKWKGVMLSPADSNCVTATEASTDVHHRVMAASGPPLVSGDPSIRAGEEVTATNKLEPQLNQTKQTLVMATRCGRGLSSRALFWSQQIGLPIYAESFN